MRLKNLLPKDEKEKATVLVAVVVVTLAAAFFYQGMLLHDRTIEGVIHDQQESIALTINNVDLYSFTPYQNRLHSLLQLNPGIGAALFNQDRQGLYRLTLPLYQALLRENPNLYIMHYHLPDGRSFLRMHTPEKFGDDLRRIRPAIQQVHREQKAITGYEIGIYDAFYRVIQPVFHQGSYAGVVELGIRVDTVLESLRKLLESPITTYFLTDNWQAVITDRESIVLGQHTLLTHGEPLFRQLPRELDLSLAEQRFTLDGNTYLLHTFPTFNDFKGEPLGGFVVMQEITGALAAKRTFIARSLFFSAILLGITLTVLHLSFSRLIGKLASSHAAWERTFDAIGDIVTIMDGNLQIIRANKAAHRILGAEPGSLIGQHCYRVFADLPAACEGCPGVATMEHCRVSSAEIHHDKLGKTFLITTSPVADEKGEFTQIVHIAKDITEKLALERQLRQAQKMEAIGNLAGGIAHDFNNILTAIAGYVQLILLKVGHDERIAQNAVQVRAAIKRATDLVSQILTFSRQTEHEKKSVQVAPIVKEALKLLRSSIPASIELRQSLESTATILGDPTQLHQVIMNLATNAYHSMLESGGVLGVTLREIVVAAHERRPELIMLPPGRYLRLEVSDTGCGMAPETLTKIFEPYFTTKEIGRGTGLGLAVVHGIVSGHRGVIKVYSEPGQGTTFHVYLPIVDREPDQIPAPVVEAPLRVGSEQLMLVDDEENIAELGREVLALYGYRVTVCRNGAQGLESFRENPDRYQLVITDLTMPAMNGLRLAAEVKALRPRTPVILCSGHSEITSKAGAEAQGVDLYLQKPLEMMELVRAVRALLDRQAEGGQSPEAQTKPRQA
ncbi:cache domain-containing protein [Desulfurivibrio sp. D14AmB]|uniref:cache domain-containing protein n=1 Tax=Desulfurivibrio sp. D14AmB TaxID=3374370 RepID=UPI00376F3BB2